MILVLLFSIPSIQTRVGKYATIELNKAYNTNINIDKVGLKFNGDVELKSVLIRDFNNDTLIKASEIASSIINFKNLSEGILNFGDITLNETVFNIITYKGKTETNLDVFVARFDSEHPRKKKSKFIMSSSDVTITNGIFRLINENKETPKVLEFNHLNINATNFLINGSAVSMRVNTLNFRDSRGLEMKNLTTNFSYTTSEMDFGNLDIKTKNSSLKGELRFNYKREDLKHFVDKVNVVANFKDMDVSFDELNVFYNEFGANQSIRGSVGVTGTLNDLNANQLKLRNRSNTKIYGDANFKNLFNAEENNFSMNGNFSNLTSSYKDLKRLLPNVLGATIPSAFEKLGVFKINGNTNITSSKINAKLTIDTELGIIDSDLAMTNVNDIDKASYDGTIIFDEFNLGEMLNDPKLEKTSANLKVNGYGFKQENINTEIVGDVYDIKYNNYTYKNLDVSGKVKDKVFNGKLATNDENIKLKFDGLIDFSKTVYDFDFRADVAYANLRALNLYKKDRISKFKGSIDMKMMGTNINDAAGRITFNKTNYKNENDDYYFEDFEIVSRFEAAQRFIEINSPDIIKGQLSGDFKFEDIGKLVENSVKSIYTNYKPNDLSTSQYIDFNFKIYNKIIEVFYPELKVGKNTYVKGRVETDEKAFKLTFKSPEIKLKKYFANNIELQIDNKNPLFNTSIEIDSLNTNLYNVSKFNLVNVTLKDTLFMRSEFKGGLRNNDEYDLSFYHTINEDNKSVIGFKESQVKFKDNLWTVNHKKDRDHKIIFDRDLKDFKIEPFVLNHYAEEIKLSGTVRDSTHKDLKLKFKDVDLRKITPRLKDVALKGTVNGNLDVIQKNGSYLPNSTITIDDFTLNNQNLGAFDASIIGNASLTNYKVNAKIKDDTSNTFSAIGDIEVSSKSSAINVDLNFNNFGLELLNPFLEGILENIRGNVTGKTRIVGNLNKPNINGALKVNNGGLAVPYLNIDYDFEEEASVTLNNQTFRFNTIKLTDTKYASSGIVDGTLSHNNFSKWRLNLNVNTPRLLVLDTEYTEDALYYGTGFMSGIASIAGPSDALRINVIGATEKGTLFKIPLSDSESFGDNSFIHFLSPEEKKAKLEGKNIQINNTTGLALDFDLDITQDALVEIVIDRKSGSTISGRGEGGLLVEINTNGKFNMYGDISVFEGDYNFLYGGLIEKKFKVEPGSTLAWNGDPLKALINIKAIYKTNTNPSALLDNPINRSIPVELGINLTDELEQPQVDYDFKFPTVNSAVRSELEYRLESREDREKQALFFLASGGFSRALENFNPTGTLTERLNSLINSFFTDSDNKINIGLNYEAGQNRPDFQTDDRLGLTLQTQITDRVLINGKVGVPVGGAGESVVAGDVQIDFLLNEEGTLTAKVFNRENSIRNFGEEIGYTQGLGVAYSVDFDTFGELLRLIFKKNNKTIKEEKNDLKENTPEDNPLPAGIEIKKKD